MLTRIQALNYRALHYIDQSILPFQVLIGPNASGKSTFLDVIAFMSDIITKSSVEDAVRERAPDIRDLTWMRSSDWLELVVEAQIPAEFHLQYPRLRYEVRVGVDPVTNSLELSAETLWFTGTNAHSSANGAKIALFPDALRPPERVTLGFKKSTPPGWRKIVSKAEGGNDYFRAETTEWNNMFRLGPKRSALANLPEDETRFRAATWFKRYIAEGVQRIVLNSEALRRPSPPQSPRTFLPDGANLPWVIYDLEQKYPSRLKDWIRHIQTALPDIETIFTIERPEDRHRYLVVKYRPDLEAPSWVVSDGTLRMLALTIMAYLPSLEGIYLIEEPENGIHPTAVETVFQSLEAIQTAQVFLATHSPVILNLTKPSHLLCFARTEEGETSIVHGDHHPALLDWQGEISLSTLFAAGVLG